MLVMYRQDGTVRIVKQPIDHQERMDPPPIEAYGKPYSQCTQEEKRIIAEDDRKRLLKLDE